jgi:2-dehydro-3-deoxy-D-arabinonate dehydratase
MALCRYMTYAPTAGRQKRWGWVREGTVTPLDDQAVMRMFIEPEEAGLASLEAKAAGDPIALSDLDVTPGRYGHPSLVAPVLSGQEIWAAGVTYESSKLARMAESSDGGDFYAKVYLADRPELFLKATPGRVVGPNDQVRIREDSYWNVPEPELTALAAANGRILGYTIGNDMSSRDIEGANPLYLPQAKVYRASCALGPVVIPAEAVDAQSLTIRLTITRAGATAYEGETSTARMRRTVQELVSWLFRENDFPQGVYLLTGTGLIPPDDFTLQPEDSVAIAIEGIGVLRNTVARGAPPSV